MVNYWHIQYTFVLKDLPVDLIGYFNIVYKYHSAYNYLHATDDESQKRWQDAEKLEKKLIDTATYKPFIHTIEKISDIFGVLLYESEYEVVETGIEWPSGFDPNVYMMIHGNFDIKDQYRFKELIELLRKYIHSGSAWGWWESDMSSSEVFL